MEEFIQKGNEQKSILSIRYQKSMERQDSQASHAPSFDKQTERRGNSSTVSQERIRGRNEVVKQYQFTHQSAPGTIPFDIADNTSK